MIFDVRSDDERTRRRCSWIRVALNGVDITNSCIMVDDVKRVVLREKHTKDGHAQRDPNDSAKFWLEELKLKRSDVLKVTPKIGIPPELCW